MTPLTSPEVYWIGKLSKMLEVAREKTKDFQGRKPRFEGHCTIKYCIGGQNKEYEQRFKLGEEVKVESDGILICDAGVAVRINSQRLKHS